MLCPSLSLPTLILRDFTGGEMEQDYLKPEICLDKSHPGTGVFTQKPLKALLNAKKQINLVEAEIKAEKYYKYLLLV